MSGESQTGSKRGWRRESTGRAPTTLKGLLKTFPPAKAEKLRRDIRRSVLRLLIKWTRTELRQVDGTYAP
jgi:hypothetical protein